MIELLTSDGTAVLLTNISTAFSVLMEVSAIVLSIFGIRYFVQLREKQNEAVFSYLARMRSQLTFMLIILEKDRNGIFAYLKEGENFNHDTRDSIRDANLRKSLADHARFTLEFLNETENQYPPEGADWSRCLKSFYRLLFVCENMATIRDSYWTKHEPNETREKEFNTWVEDAKTMLSLIEEKQVLVEKRLSTIPNRIVRLISNMLFFRFLVAVKKKLFLSVIDSKPISYFRLRVNHICQWMEHFINDISRVK